MRFLLFSVSFTLIFSCASTHPPEKLPATERELRAFLEKRIPIGTGIEDGRELLLGWGFSVQSQVGARFEGLSAPSDFLYGDLEGRTGSLVARRVQVALVHSNGRILRVLATMGLTGP